MARTQIEPTSPPEESRAEKERAGGDGPRGSAGLRRVLRLARPEWPWLGVGTVFLFGSLVPQLYLPLAFGEICDIIIRSEESAADRRKEVDEGVLRLAVLIAGGSVLTFCRAFIFNTAGERVVARLRLQLFRAILRQEMGMFDRRKTGELLSRLSADCVALQDVATSNLSMFLRGTAQLIISAVLMFSTSWRLSLTVFLVVPLLILTLALYGRQVKKVAVTYSDALGVSADVAQESISNVRTLRAFAAEAGEGRKYERAVGNPDDPQQMACCWCPKKP